MSQFPTFAEFYRAKLKANPYRRNILKSRNATANIRHSLWVQWDLALHSAVGDSTPVRLAVFDSWITNKSRLDICTLDVAESTFLRLFRGSFDYLRSNPDYLTPLARKFHKENKHYVA